MDFRARVGDERFADVAFASLQTDPVGALAASYERIGLEFSERSRTAVERWAAQHEPGSHGTHTYTLADFPALVAAAPKGLFLVGPPALDLDGDTGRGEQPLCFVDQTTHDMRIGWYTDTYRRTPDGWRLASRSMTFLRKSGARDHGRPHDPTRPVPSTS